MGMRSISSVVITVQDSSKLMKPDFQVQNQPRKWYFPITDLIFENFIDFQKLGSSSSVEQWT